MFFFPAGPSNGDDYGVAACDEQTGKCELSCNTEYTMTNLYRWGTTNLLWYSAERSGTECLQLNMAPRIESKVISLSQCQQSDPMTGGPSVAPYLVARNVRYLPVIWFKSAVYSSASERL